MWIKEYVELIPIPKIDFSSRNKKVLDKLKLKYKENEFLDIKEDVKSLPSNSAILHDFLSFLAQKMTELNQNKYLLQLFIENKLNHGTDEMIKVIKLLQTHPEWDDNASDTLKKEIAKSLIQKLDLNIKKTDKLIDDIVYHLYGLTKEEIDIIENFFR